MTTLPAFAPQRRLWLRRLAGLGLAGVAWRSVGAATAPAAPASGPPPSDPVLRPALMAPRALGAMLLDVAQAGERLVAVGERGTVLLSDDLGATWRQTACPVSVTLTALAFATPRLGWATGHAGVVLHTQDGGSTWALQLEGRAGAALALQAAERDGKPALVKRAQQLVDDGADKPLLALHADADGHRVVVVGAYGIALGSDDGGATWHSWIDRIDNPRGLHINAVQAAGSAMYLAGEQGLLHRSDDAGLHFTALASPYAGSWFALAAPGTDGLVCVGLRGNAWWSQDRGASFQRSTVPTPASLIAVQTTRDGQLLLLDQAGQFYGSADAGRSFDPIARPPGPPTPPATAMVELADGSLLASTVIGPARLPRPNAVALATTPRNTTPKSQ